MEYIEVQERFHDDNMQLLEKIKPVQSYQEFCRIIEQYPWEREFELAYAPEQSPSFEVGALAIFAGDPEGAYVFMLPLQWDVKHFELSYEIHLTSGFLGIGAKVCYCDYDKVTLEDLKMYVKELFDYSIEQLYEKYN